MAKVVVQLLINLKRGNRMFFANFLETWL